ncbi:unnamed protein product [Brachionus calyciflorus]|uniref:Uncharacterized protein n=1 Tax=Brachionus calyciflorus TaxID=104777 RepID=A0A814A7R5_9BILA|nr:unnamed protein product [Brachionus calyciflorus]
MESVDYENFVNNVQKYYLEEKNLKDSIDLIKHSLAEQKNELINYSQKHFRHMKALNEKKVFLMKYGFDKFNIPFSQFYEIVEFYEDNWIRNSNFDNHPNDLKSSGNSQAPECSELVKTVDSKENDKNSESSNSLDLNKPAIELPDLPAIQLINSSSVLNEGNYFDDDSKILNEEDESCNKAVSKKTKLPEKSRRSVRKKLF